MTADDQTMKKFGIQYFAAMATDLRGLAKVEDVAANYAEVFGDEGDAQAFVDFAYSQHDAASPYGLLEIEDGKFFVNPMLMLAYKDAEGEAPEGVIKAQRDSLPSSFTSLLDAQKDFDPRPVDPVMLGEGSLLSWKLKQPAALALSTYFKDRLTEDQDEATVDAAMKGLIQMTTGGYKATDMIDYLISTSITVQEKETVDLLTNLISAMPRWDINGWSPDDLSVKEFGYKISNAPVSTKHVGRNDPCPCGSGKKYKKCCGRFVE